MNKNKQLIKHADELLSDLRRMIDAARQRFAATVNTELTLLYWQVGSQIRTDILQSKRAKYGEQIISTVSAQLTSDYGKGFDIPNLSRMIRFAEYFPDEQIVVTVSQQLSWSHFLAILPIKHDLARQFYAEMCRIKRRSVRMLRQKINSMLFEGTAISRKPAQVIE